MAADSKELIDSLLTSCSEKYEKARKLIDEESKKDPESEPYRSLYAAKNLFAEIKACLVRAADGGGLVEEVLHRVTILTAAMNYSLGQISVETEELSTGEELLLKCEEALKDWQTSKECVMVVMACLNQLGILWSLRDEMQKSAEYLERSEVLCRKYRDENGQAPCDIQDLFSVESQENDTHLENNWPRFEKIVTHTLYYLAQVYNSLGKTVQAAIYCHTTLRRQLEGTDLDHVDWAVNAATLSQFFVAQNSFGDARHHLACATHILDTYEAAVKTQAEAERNENDEELLDTVQHRKADVARCWGKYGLLLLSVSWDALMRNSVGELVEGVNDIQIAAVNSETNEDPTSNHENPSVKMGDTAPLLGTDSEKPFMTFKSLEVTAIEDEVTTKRVLDFDQARTVFLFTQRWLNLAKEYYSLREHASDHVLIVRDLSKLYRVLAYFESNEDRCCKMHKRRIDMLEAVLGELNPQYYLNVCQQLQFELGDIYSEMMGLKLSRLEVECGQAERNRIAKKVNLLIEQSLKYFGMFLDSQKDANGKFPEEFSDDVVRPVLLAHFLIARLHSKMVPLNPAEQLRNLKNCVEHYAFVCDYCEKHPTVKDVMKEELWVSKEMVELLPKKMDRIMNGYQCI